MTDANLPVKVLNKERRSDGKFKKWTATNNTGRSPKRSLSQRRRGASERQLAEAVTDEEFFKVWRRVYCITQIEDNDPAMLSAVLAAAKLIIEHKMGKPKVRVDVETTSTVSVEQRIIMAKVAAQMIPAPELPALPEPIIDAEVVEVKDERVGSPQVPDGDRVGVPAVPAEVH